MSYIIIETHGGAECTVIVTDKDGNNMVFDTWDKAEREVAERQACIIIEL